MPAPETPRPRRSRPGQIASALVAMLAVSVVAGVMIAVAVTPAIAVTGGSAKDGTGLFGELPADLAIAKLDQKTEIYAKNGDRDVRIASFFAQNREVVGWKDISDAAKHAAIAGEDVRFYEHGGVDPVGIVRATVANLMGEDLQGASTITQQYVKNVCVQEAENLTSQAAVQKAYATCTDTSVGRKLREARYAIALEKKYTKDQILLGYLNIAGFGGRVYGIESAAQYYFDTTAAKLTVAQAAALMAIVNNPQALRLDVADNLQRNTERRDYILGVELRNDLITKAQYDEAIATKTKPTITPTASGCEAAGSAGFFCDYVVNTILNDPAYGRTRAIREANLQTAGWKIYTTVDLGVERKAKAAMSAYVPATSELFNIGGAAVSVQVGTGRIVSMVTNKKYEAGQAGRGSTAINYAADRQLGASGGFQPGSTFKVFTLLQWLKDGHGLNEQVLSDPGTVSDFTACGKPYEGEPYEFGNDADGEGGYQSVLSGTQRSINGTFVRMAQQLDLCDIQKTAEEFGVEPVTGKASPTNVAPFIIGGAYTVSPVAIANAYATIANNGTYCTPVAIDRVVKTDGSELTVPKSTCKQVIDPQVAVAAAYALRGVFQGGTASGDNTDDGLYEFGKTGTTNDATQTWMVGTTSKVATAVWVGNVTGQQNLRQTYLNYCAAGYGAQAAVARHCVWKDVQTAANAVYGGSTDWAQPEAQYLYGAPQQVAPVVPTTPAAGTVPDVTGQTKDAAAQLLVQAGFSWAYGDDVPSSRPAGEVESTEPAAGSQAAPGSQVIIHGSSGTTG